MPRSIFFDELSDYAQLGDRSSGESGPLPDTDQGVVLAPIPFYFNSSVMSKTGRGESCDEASTRNSMHSRVAFAGRDFTSLPEARLRRPW
jgi:hypothetical protein